MKALKIVGMVVGGLVAAIGLFLAACFLVFWREPDPKETCENVARLSADPKVARSELAMRECVKTMSRQTYGFNAKRRLASYRRCVHGAGSAAELKQCDTDR